MRLTNKLNLPQPLVDAVRNDGYSSGDAHISVTTLLKPPRIVTLEKQHAGELEEDAADRIWSLMGQVVHGILERAEKDGIAERRLSIEVEGWKISGQMDRYLDGVLQDYKVVTAYKFKGSGVPPEYEAQINVYAEILRQNGHDVRDLEIVGILRDWSKMEAKRDPEFPQQQVVRRQVPMWTEEEAQKFIRERVILHQQARVSLPECSPEDRWAKAPVYAVMKRGKKRAERLYPTEAQANDHAALDPSYYVVHRPGESIRCANYCPVAKFCSQYQEMTKAKEEIEVA